MLSISALLLTAWLGEPMDASAADTALSVDVAPELHCPSGSAVISALTKQLAPMRVVRDKDDRQRFHLKLRPHGAHSVALTLYEHSARLIDRTIDVEGRECQGIAQTVALITATWTKSARGAIDRPSSEPPPDPRQEVPAPPPPPPPPPAEVVGDREVGGESKTSDERKTFDDSPAIPPRPSAAWPGPDQTNFVEPAPRPVAPALPIVPPLVVEAQEPIEVLPPPPAPREEPRKEPAKADELPAEQAAPPAPAVEAAPAVPAVHHLRFEAAAGCTVSLGSPALPTATGRLGLEGARNRWLLGVRGHVESARTLEDEVDLRQAQVDMAFGANLIQTARWHGALLGGAGINLFSARAPNHDHSGVMRSFSPYGLLALRAGIQPHPSFDVFTASEFAIGFRRERFVSDGELVARTARGRTRLLLGISWHVF